MAARLPCLTFVVSATALLAEVATAALVWETFFSEGSPLPARKHAAAAFISDSGYLAIFGGIGENDTIFRNTTIVYTAVQWYSFMVEKGPPALYGATAVDFDSKFYIFGGCNYDRCFNDIWAYSNYQWEKVEVAGGVKPRGRRSAAGGMYKGSNYLVVSQGTDMGTKLADTYFFDFSQKRWFLVENQLLIYNPLIPHSAAASTSAMISPALLLMSGGCEKNGQCPSAESWSFDLQTSQWHWLGPCGVPRVDASATLIRGSNGRFYVVVYGGKTTGPAVLWGTSLRSNELIVFEVDIKKWSTRKAGYVAFNGLPVQRHGAAMVTASNVILMYGGATDAGHILNDLWKLSGTFDNWPVVDPCSGPYFGLLNLHGLFMTIAFGFVLPAGAAIGLYFSIRRHTTFFRWRHLHGIVQGVGAVFAFSGFVCAVTAKRNDAHFSCVHGVLGLIVVLLFCIQPVIILLSTRFAQFKRNLQKVHYGNGLLLTTAAALNIVLGLLLLHTYASIWISLAAYLIIVCLALIILQMIDYMLIQSE